MHYLVYFIIMDYLVFYYHGLPGKVYQVYTAVCATRCEVPRCTKYS